MVARRGQPRVIQFWAMWGNDEKALVLRLSHRDELIRLAETVRAREMVAGGVVAPSTLGNRDATCAEQRS